ncbi:hypothetical protein, partial [Pseudomonas syringae]
MSELFQELLEVILRAICYPVGWPIVRLLSRGRYPSRGSWFSNTAEANWTVATGLAILVITMMALLHQLGVSDFLCSGWLG